MTEAIAYRYKQRTADGMHETRWTPWRSGRRRAEMMAELGEIKDTLVIVQCCVPRAEVDPINGRFNDLWQWRRSTGWRKTAIRNWFADTFDPTIRNDDNDDDDPFGTGTPSNPERLKYWHEKLYAPTTPQHITEALTLDEMDDDPPNEVTGAPTDEFPKLHEDDTEYLVRTVDHFVKNKFVDTVEFSAEGKIG